ncbi:hypothetical protein HELRODRAFT_160337 [Helobdella robusta]|uniref:Beta-lactamase n=1 Tax=Helobdella robusta TaxID=6412 RepID=T1EQ41_HELRO|nr:hypothetical protein HELRODRAFT_160337 [Helobdella robusta]ESO06184.1 hypothetical protein HELRODRAFT_160337 [Helobdella robusta]
MLGLIDMAYSYDLKDEAQAKEYLDRIGIEYRFQCYNENSPDGCHRLGSFLETVLKDWQKAFAVFQFNCSKNKHGPSCFKVGIFNLAGKGCDMNQSKAFESFERGCEYRDGPSCHNYALMHQEGKTKDKKIDFKKVEENLTKGCSYGDAHSCFRLSALYLKGEKDVPQNKELAFKYAVISCERDNPYACANVSRMYKLGDGVEKNEEQAIRYKQIATNLYNSAKEKPILSGNEW